MGTLLITSALLAQGMALLFAASLGQHIYEKKVLDGKISFAISLAFAAMALSLMFAAGFTLGRLP